MHATAKRKKEPAAPGPFNTAKLTSESAATAALVPVFEHEEVPLAMVHVSTDDPFARNATSMLPLADTAEPPA